MKLAVIGGSGLYGIDHFNVRNSGYAETPFGRTQSQLLEGELNGHEVVFLARHGEHHQIAPHELNHRANIYALKQLGVTHILSMSAVGSLREDYAPRDVVIVDQYFDRTTKHMPNSFFDEGIVAHISFAKPVCPELSALACRAAEDAILRQETAHHPKVHMGGTYVNIDGPAFSTMAESRIYRQWGLDVIGMTNLPEAKLAREAGICYSTVAMVTDYDCWHDEFESVSVELVIENLNANIRLAKEIVTLVAEGFSALKHECACSHALDYAIITHKEGIPEPKLHQRTPIIGKRLD